MASGAGKEKKLRSTSPSGKPENSVTSVTKPNRVFARIRNIGNSKGILLSKTIIKKLGFEDNAEVMVTVEKGRIIIAPWENKRKINIDLSSWEAQFRDAIKKGDKPQTDMFEGMENKFDKEEW